MASSKQRQPDSMSNLRAVCSEAEAYLSALSPDPASYEARLALRLREALQLDRGSK